MAEHDVGAYGATGDGQHDDTGAVKAAIAAAAGGGTVYFGPGTYSVGELDWAPNVTLRGAGVDVSTLKARGSGTLLRTGGGNITHVGGGLREMTLEGDHRARQGLCLLRSGRFSLERVIIQNFTQRGIEAAGALVFQANRCQILNCGTGVEGLRTPGADANLVALRDCVIASNRRCGVRWRSGSMLILDGCDIEDNGTGGDAATAALHVSGLCPMAEGIALVVDRCWFEGNHGHSAVRIDPPANAAALHIVQNSHVFGGHRTYGIYVDGVKPTRYFLQNVVAQNAVRADFYDGVEGLGFLLHSFATCVWLRGTSTQWPLATTDDEVSLRGLTGISFWLGRGQGRPPAARLDAGGGTDESPLLLYDPSSGTMKRVSWGPSNSGGRGYRALRVPN
jgi:hypothetical protein